MAAPRPPKGFVSLTHAEGHLDQVYDTIGICVDHFLPTKSRGTDFTTTFMLSDPGWFNGLGMKFRFFNEKINQLPQIQQNGDAVILRKVKTKEFNGQPIGMAYGRVGWVVLSGPSIQASTCPNGSDIKFSTSEGVGRAPPPTTDELKYIKEIRSMMDSSSLKPPPVPTALDVEHQIKEAGGIVPQRKEKWRLVRDLTVLGSATHNFADLFGEVRKIWSSDYGRVTLSLTDYTSNKRLYNYSQEPQSRDGDDFGHTSLSHEKWPGPWGRLTIEVLLFDAHAEYARSRVQVGMYVLIKNCQIKLDPNGSRLEAACRGDREDMSKVNISIYPPNQAQNDERFKDLLRRRLEYSKLAKINGLRFGFDQSGKKDSTKRSIHTANNTEADVDIDVDVAGPQKQKKSKRRERKRKILDGSEQPKTAAGPGVSQLNPSVRCNKIEVPVKSVSDILGLETLKRETPGGREFSLPFQNCCYKTRLKVVDYYPHNIADFSVPRLVTEYDSLSDNEDTDDFHLTLTAAQNNPHSVRWEWRFFLVVEDASTQAKAADTHQNQMVLLVADTDGDFLLREEACNLRASPQDLAKLREKLFVLWGNLQEEKEKTTSGSKDFNIKVQSIPFECLIKEYGVPEPRTGNSSIRELKFHRMFRMRGTTIALDG